MPIPSEIPEKYSIFLKISCVTTGSDVIFKTVYAVGKGVNSPHERLEDEEALTLFENSFLQKRDIYEVKLPWINENGILHYNYSNAERRFFNLLKQFRSNLNFYQEYETDYQDSTPLCDSSSKILGILARMVSHSVHKISLSIFRKASKQKVVFKAVSRIFDPLGFLAPYVTQTNVLFQDLWLTGIDCDKPIPEKSQSKWIKCHEQLKELPKVQTPR
ncbi:hypothetical protein AVEN_192601-1 [Araneus ventricosus]|uniref:Uncharacterized protein n=1 Tax=Araneus ventricosus TaxID=182803 RepID=A0A4Y2J6H3_ARAVE|nr:hypothetical protein AVEN_192601-1 [Araneus ventricosus]